MTTWQWLSQADGVARGTALVLLIMSVLSWVLILYKAWWLGRAQRDTARSTSAFWQASSWEQARQQLPQQDRLRLIIPAVDAIENIVGGVPAAQHSLAVASGAQVQTTRVLREALQSASYQLHWGQTVLATIGATAPFVGLLGTVWGIHQALAVLAGADHVSLEQLAGPVGEALVMTAAGLAVALPAVLAYNLLGRKGAQVEELLEGFAHDMQTWAWQQTAQANGAGLAQHQPQANPAAVATVGSR
ncbi:MotA/TolQ/ExbB proton channel family protein [Comamonas sp. J-3]|uniref:MotA/TolQ/ExbB proton channel family protein n=1 Tax=Comamonas trifloxystrobinivorans TaxID=3350256 RepID=UPI00372A1A8F